jgi:hypothetical protein
LRGDLFKRRRAWEGDNLLRPGTQKNIARRSSGMIGIAIFNRCVDLSPRDRRRKKRLQAFLFPTASLFRPND